MPYTNIIAKESELYSYIEEINYGITAPQFNNLITLVNGIINVDGNKSISNVAKSTLNSSDRSCLYRFLSSSPIDTKLIDRNRINYTYNVLDNNIAPNSIGFLSIDDTLSKHSIKSKCMDGLGFHYSHTDGKCVLSHCVVTSNFTVGDTSIPINHSMYYKEDYCKTFGEKFRSKQSIARTFIQEFKSPSNCKKVYVLTDSWYTSSPVIDETLKHGYNFIGAIKSNRIIHKDGVKMQLSELSNTLDPYNLDVVTVKDKEYRVYSYKGKITGFDDVLITICY